MSVISTIEFLYFTHCYDILFQVESKLAVRLQAAVKEWIKCLNGENEILDEDDAAHRPGGNPDIKVKIENAKSISFLLNVIVCQVYSKASSQARIWFFYFSLTSTGAK